MSRPARLFKPDLSLIREILYKWRAFLLSYNFNRRSNADQEIHAWCTMNLNTMLHLSFSSAYH